MFIGKNWKIETDPMNYLLMSRHISRKTGEEYCDVEGYYSSLASALKAIPEIELRATGMKDLHTVMEKLESIEKDISLALKKQVCEPVGASKTMGDR